MPLRVNQAQIVLAEYKFIITNSVATAVSESRVFVETRGTRSKSSSLMLNEDLLNGENKSEKSKRYISGTCRKLASKT